MKLKKLLAIALLAAILTSSVATTAVSAAVGDAYFPYSTIDADVDYVDPAIIAAPLDIGGQTVILRQGLAQSADIHLHGGNLIIVGNYDLTKGTLYTEGGTVTVSGDMNVSSGTVLAGFADGDAAATDNGGSIVVSGAVIQNSGTVSGGNGLISIDGTYRIKSGTLTAANGNVHIKKLFSQTGGTVKGENGVLSMDGNYNQKSGKLEIGAGDVTIGASYRLANVSSDENGQTVYGDSSGIINMSDENGHFTVCGNFVTKSSYSSGNSYNKLANGTLELRGNFTQLKGDGGNFSAEKGHKVIFTGKSVQTVSFESPTSSHFGTIEAGSNALVNIVSGSILSVGSNVTVENFNQYGNLDVNGNTLTVTGDFVQNGNVTLNGGTLNVSGNWTQPAGTLDLNNGRLKIDGNYTLAAPKTDEEGEDYLDVSSGVLKMNDENDYMVVGGSFITKSWYGAGSSYNHLIKGTLELKGDFTQLKGDNNNFCAGVEHKVIFSGNGHQNVSFESPTSSHFGTIEAGSNALVNIVSGSILSVGSDVTIENFNQYGNLDVNGKTLTITGDVIENGNIYLNNGVINVGGNWLQPSGTLDLNNGRLKIDGNYTLAAPGTDTDGNDVLNSSSGVLKMNDDGDYMVVGGNFLTKSWYGAGSSYNDLVRGTLELKGDFTQLGGDNNNFCAGEGHKVVFSGTSLQTVYFESNNSSRFGKIEATDNSEIDIVQGGALTVNSGVVLRNFNQFGSLDLNGQSVTVTNNFIQNGNVNVNCGEITVNGTWQQKNGTLDLNDGSVKIMGDYILANVEEDEEGNSTFAYSSGVLKMNNDNDYMLVCGDFVTKSWYGAGSSYNDLVRGTLELKGDFTQLKGDNNNFCAGADHKVIFSGNELQSVFFESMDSSHFGKMEATNNTEIDFVRGSVLTIGSNVTVRNFNQYGNLDLAGNTMTVTANVTQNGNININGGSINVIGDWQQTNGSLDLNNGTVNIEGNYINAGYGEDEEGKQIFTVSTGTLKMNDEKDYMRVGGNFVTKAWYGSGSSYNDLTKGTLELCGDFTQMKGDNNNFRAGKDHKVLFNGNGRQIVNFGNPTSSHFGTILEGENAVVDIVSGSILSVGSDVVIETFNQYGEFDVNGHNMIISGDVTQNGNITVSGGSIETGGNWLQLGGILDLNGGSVFIDGNYTIATPDTDDDGNVTYSSSNGVLKMNDDGDYMLVGGDFLTKSWYGAGSSYNDLVKGTLELKGDFTQLKGDNNNFCAGVDHKVIFSGDGRQNVSFENPTSSHFGTIEAGSNALVNIVSGSILSVGSDVTIENFSQYGNLDVNGKTLNITGNVTENGNITLNKGTVNVGGNWLQPSGILDLNAGTLIIDGNYTLATPGTDTDGNDVLSSSVGVLKMNDDGDYMLVGGSFTTKSWYGRGSSYNDLVKGTLELKGDFTQLAGDGYNFSAGVDHKVIFSGEGLQTVRFESKDSSGFGTLLRTDNENVDIVSGSFMKLANDVTLKNFSQSRELDLEGYRMTLTGDMVQSGRIYLSGGTADVAGNWTQTNGVLDINNGMIRIGGDYALANINTDSEGNVSYSSSTGVLKMNDARDYMLVEGNFLTMSWYGSGSNYNDITNGILEVRGNFTQLNGDGSNFAAGVNHITVLSGEESQTVTFSGRSSHFGKLAVSTLKTDPNFYYLPYEEYQYYSSLYEFATAIGISTLSSTSVKRGESVDVLARVTMAGTGCIYEIYVSINGGARELLYTHIGPTCTYTYTPPRVGEYEFTIISHPTKSAPVEETLYLTVNPADELTTGASLSSAEITDGDTVTVNTAVKGGVAPYTYSFAYRAAESENWTIIDSTDPSAQFTPAGAGEYEVRVLVTDADGSVAYTVLELKVNPDTTKVVNRSTINSEAITVGSRVVMKGAAEGGSGEYTYEYMYKRTSAKVWKSIDALKDDPATAYLTPTSAGDFDIRIIATDTEGKTDEKRFVVAVSDGKSTAFQNNSYLSTTGTKPKTRVYLYGAAEGSSGYRYAYYYKRTTAKAWTVIGTEFGTMTSAYFKPTSEGEFSIKIDIMDENGEIVSRMFALSISNAYVDTTMTNTSRISTSSALPGTKIVLTGSAEGGAGGYTYAYYYKKENASNWTVLGTEFSTSQTQTFTPKTLGNYIVKIAVKDADGGMTSTNFDLEITNDPKPEIKALENISTISATAVTAGTTVKVTGAAENGTAPYSFKYYYKKSTSSKWVEMSSADGAYATIKVRNTGEYNFRTVATDAEGREAERIFKVTVS